MKRRSNPNEFTIDVGVHDRENLNSWSKRFHVQNITIYPHYFHLFAMNDIALVKLSVILIKSDFQLKLNHW